MSCWGAIGDQTQPCLHIKCLDHPRPIPPDEEEGYQRSLMAGEADLLEMWESWAHSSGMHGITG